MIFGHGKLIACTVECLHLHSFAYTTVDTCVAIQRDQSGKLAVLIVRYIQKKKHISIVFYCSESLSIAHNLGTTGPIQVWFSAKCTFPNEHFNQIENRKCHMSNFRPIPLDRITYHQPNKIIANSLFPSDLVLVCTIHYVIMNVTNRNQSLVKSEIHHFFIRLTICDLLWRNREQVAKQMFLF